MSKEYQFPWCSHHRLHLLGNLHQFTGQKSPAAPILTLMPEKKIASPSIHPHNLLQGHHREHPDHLHLCFVWELPHFQPQSCTKGHADSGVDHQHLNPLPARYVHPPVRLLGHQLVIDSHPSHGLFTTLPSGMLRPPLSGPMWHNTL